jgi:hypothetical protein
MLMRRQCFVVVIGFGLSLLLAGCEADDLRNGGTQGITIVHPTSAPVTDFDFPVEVQLTPNAFDPTTLAVTLNGEPLTLSGGPDHFTTTVHPGPPLRDANVLVVEATRVGGGTASSRVDFQYLPPKARAFRIENEADLIRGPLADGRVGDYLLANTVARFVVQDINQRDIYSVGAFGGNIIDAELVAHPDHDNFLEIQPAINIETVVNAQTLDILNDGQDGSAAIIRTCGPDDLLDFVNPSTIIRGAGFPFPDAADDADYDVTACTEYHLEPGTNFVRLVTTVANNEDVDRPLFVGDYINGCGELEQWTSTGLGFGELLFGPLGVFSYIGFGEATGVDYAHITIPIPGSPFPESNFFTAAGVSYILQSDSVPAAIILGSPANFVVAAHDSRSYTRYFGVGDGSGGNAVTMENVIKGIPSGTLRGCVTVGDAPAPATRVTVGTQSGGVLTGVIAPYLTDAEGCYTGTLPVGSYVVAAARRGTPYEGSGAAPALHTVEISEDAVTTQDIALPATGHVHVAVVNQDGAPIPGRVTIVGFDPSPEPTVPGPAISGTQATGMFNDLTDSLRFGLTRFEYTDAQGIAELDVEPGSYQLYVSRGTEYSVFSMPVTITAGNTTNIDARITQVVDSAGFISSDYHVHGINSADARVSHTNRVLQFAGEGVDNIIMTDHHSHTDLTPVISGLGLTPFVRSMIGEEITTWDYGHFNAYPLLIDRARPSGGSTDWGVAAPAGEDFPSRGSYSLTPAALAELTTTGATSTPDTVIQINHIDSHFGPLKIDTALIPPQSFITGPEKLAYRLDPNSGNLFHHFEALELWNGESRGQQNEFLLRRIGIWFNHLNQGLLTTAIADTDTHNFFNLDAHGGRTWTASSTDEPAAISDAEVADAVRTGRAVGGQGLFVLARLRAADDGGARADFTLGGSTTVVSAGGDVELDIRVQSPLWAAYDRIEIYANATTVVAGRNGDVPVLYGAEPTLVLTKGDDFEVNTVDVFPGVPGAQRFETIVTVPFADLAVDTWFVVVAKGTDGVSPPMFPIVASDLSPATNTTLANLVDGNLGEGGVLALGFTNALFADVDGVAGFQPPRR